MRRRKVPVYSYGLDPGLILQTLVSRYALPIQAVDTHRPKPKGPAPAAIPSTARRDYYGADTK